MNPGTAAPRSPEPFSDPRLLPFCRGGPGFPLVLRCPGENCWVGMWLGHMLPIFRWQTSPLSCYCCPLPSFISLQNTLVLLSSHGCIKVRTDMRIPDGIFFYIKSINKIFRRAQKSVHQLQHTQEIILDFVLSSNRLGGRQDSAACE